MAAAGTHHSIQNKYTFWYMRRGRSRGVSESYEDSIKQLGTFTTVEAFWSIYNHIVRPNDITEPTELHLFKHGIKPLWEDDQNARGGKWSVRLKKGLASYFWEELLLAVVGEQFDVGNEICGAVVSIRHSEDIISVWNRNADNTDALNKIRDHVRRLFRLPNFITLDYKRHDSSGVASHRPRRHSSAGSSADGDAGTFGGASGSGRGGNGGGGSSGRGLSSSGSSGGRWVSRRIQQQKAARGDGAATTASAGDSDSMPPWMAGGAAGSRDRVSRSREGGRNSRDNRDSGWGSRGVGGGFGARRDAGTSSWSDRRQDRRAESSTGFWRTDKSSGTASRGGGGGGGDSDRRAAAAAPASSFTPSSAPATQSASGNAWRSDNRWAAGAPRSRDEPSQ